MTSYKLSDYLLRKEIVSLFIDSPLYFTIPLQKRLELVKQYGENRSYDGLRNYFVNWIETGHFIKPTFLVNGAGGGFVRG